MQGGEDENPDEKEVRQLEQAVVAPAHKVEGRDPHRGRAHGGHPPHGDVEPVVMLLDGGGDGDVDRVAPPVRPHPVHNEQEGVREERREGQVAGERVVKHGALVRDPQSRPDLAVAGDRHEDDGEVGGAHEAEVDRESLQPAKWYGMGGKGHGNGR